MSPALDSDRDNGARGKVLEAPASVGLAPWVAGVVVIAAVYIFFLLYAQFGFLQVLELRLNSVLWLQRAMGAMGFAGLLTSLGAAWALGKVPTLRLLRAGLAGGALAALLAPTCTAVSALIAIAVLIGASTALATVSLAYRLRFLLGGRRLGLGVGLGTGLAYLLSNVPLLFAGSPVEQSVAASLACLAGLAATPFLERGETAQPPVGEPLSRPAGLMTRDFAGLGFAAVVLAFLALIWLDSAAFAIIQQSPVLRGATWAGQGKIVIGWTHLAAALIAGWRIDRGNFHGLLLSAVTLFAVAFRLLSLGGVAAAISGSLYAMGISFYSVALVVYPSAGGEAPGRVPGRFRAALLFGVAGWLGSGLGIAMAQGREQIPRSFVLIAAVLLLLAWALGSGRLAGLLRRHGLTFTGGLLALGMFGGGGSEPNPTAEARLDAAVAGGRQVYIAEGCIGCHSQYVRPLLRDTELWGPLPGSNGEDRVGANERPPLYGNRRQGPDLSNAGLRRSATWHRLHLLDPRTLEPASRMPSYRHLFVGDGRRGSDLVAYLTSLRAAPLIIWAAQVAAHPMAESFRGGSGERGAVLFASYCAACHGSDGRGHGPLAAAVFRPAMDLTKGEFWAVSWGPGADSADLALARLVKFGLLGTSMPGHETLPDREVADLVAWVQQLSKSRELGGPASAEPSGGWDEG